MVFRSIFPLLYAPFRKQLTKRGEAIQYHENLVNYDVKSLFTWNESYADSIHMCRENDVPKSTTQRRREQRKKRPEESQNRAKIRTRIDGNSVRHSAALGNQARDGS